MTPSERARRWRLALAIRFVSWLRFLVPRRHRADWLAEWRGELGYLSGATSGSTARRPDVLAHSLHALPHAAAYRRPQNHVAALRQDMRHALRRLMKTPGFTSVAMATVAIGVGANAAVFSVIHSTLITPLPYPDADRLVFLWKQAPGMSLMTTPRLDDITRWQEHAVSFEAIYAYAGEQLTITGDAEPRELVALRVLPGFFGFLGVRPAVGREFTEDDARADAAVAVISNGLWRSDFGGGAVLGRTLTLDGRRHTVVGVMPPEFHLSAPFDDTLVWLPLSMDDPEEHQSPFAIGRLNEGVTPERANQELAAIAAGLEGEQDAASWPGIARRPQDLNGATLRTSLVMLQGTVAIVLLIACANVANLLLARGAGRHTDMAVRAALGATRGRLVRQLLTEHLMLAIGGGLLGYGLARAGVAVLVALRPQDITALATVRVDSGIFFFTIAVAALTGTLFGLVPALQASRPAIVESLKSAGRSPVAPHGRSWLRDALIVGEVALALPLLVAAGLLLASLSRLVNADLGFDTTNVLTLQVSLPESRYPTDVERREFRDILEARIRQVAGGRLEGLAVSGSTLPTLGLWFGTFAAEGQEPIEAFTNVAAHAGVVSPGYFATLGVGLVDGRYFGPDDLTRSDNPVLLNATWARRMWGDEKVAGKRLRVEGRSGPSYHHVVGVIEDAMLVGPTGSMGDLQIFQPGDDFSNLAMLIRTVGDPLPLAGSFRALVWAIDPDLPVRDVRRLDQAYASRLGLQRFQATVLAGFAVVAVVLALVGVYGVLSQLVGQRRDEIGIRMALGASRARVMSMIGLHGMRMVLAGVGIGLVAAAALTRFIESHLYEVRALDPVTYLAASALVVLAAAVACLVPTLAASRLDATVVLRQP